VERESSHLFFSPKGAFYHSPGQRSFEKIKTAHAKAQRSAKKKSLVFFASFAYFAALREPGFSVHGLIHSFNGLGQRRVLPLEAL